MRARCGTSGTSTYQPVQGQRAFLHIGAANYRAVAAVNGKFVCQHEGGFTPFDCEVTNVIKAGDNNVVIEVDDTRIADGVPTVKTDWYNYGGLTRDVSIVSVPSAFIDDFELHLDRETRTKIAGYVHVEGAAAGTPVSVSLPEAGGEHAEGVTDAEGRVRDLVAGGRFDAVVAGDAKALQGGDEGRDG